ncbi:MAG: Unknown protein, partial [uncultured Thiotrichaceae bacterium]
MKNIMMTMLLVGWVFINTSWATDIHSYKNVYSVDEDVLIKLTTDNQINEKDWIAIFQAEADNDWANVVSWVWAKDTSDADFYGNWYQFEDRESDLFNQPGGHGKYSVKLPVDDYEARFFLNNSYDVEKSIAFSVR